jgi:hypothetical protein
MTSLRCWDTLYAADAVLLTIAVIKLWFLCILIKPLMVGTVELCFSTAGPRPGTASSRLLWPDPRLIRKNLQGRGLTEAENYCLRVRVNEC